MIFIKNYLFFKKMVKKGVKYTLFSQSKQNNNFTFQKSCPIYSFYKKILYRVSHLNLSPPIIRLGGQVSKKVPYKSCMVLRGNQNGVPFNFWF